MRLSGFIVSFILFVAAILIVSHRSWANSSAGASSSSGGHSSGGVSSSSSGSHSSATGSTSHVSGTSSAAHAAMPSKVSSPENQAERKGRSFFHPFRKREPVEAALKPMPRCWKGDCRVCPPGSRGKGGACVVTNTCLSGQAWNGFTCGVLYDRFWSNNCRSLAAQLEAERTRMRAFPGDPGEALRYRTLLEQYEQCLQRNRLFSHLPFSDPSLYDFP